MLTLNKLKSSAAAFAVPMALGATVTLAHAQTTTLEPPAATEQQPQRVDPPAAPETVPVVPASPETGGAAAPEAVAPQAASPGSSAEAVPNTAPDSGASAAAVAQDLIGQPVLDNEGTEVGSVASLKVDATGKLEEIHVKTGGIIFGLGSTTRIVPAGKFTETGKDVKLRFAKSELDQMPELGATKS